MLSQVSLRHETGPLHLDVDFTLNTEWTCIFAPSGAGKTTILRLIAGLDRPDSGRITLADQVLLDTAANIDIPPHQRLVRMVAQRPALFPHLSVLQNVQYASASTPLDPILDLCRIAHLRDQRPSSLSGGERQRVALARTLAAPTPRLLLLDEPFTGLEADLRDALILDLRAFTRERSIPVLLVTHDLAEVFTAQPHVLKMSAGRITAQGPASEVLASERDRLLARLHS